MQVTCQQNARAGEEIMNHVDAESADCQVGQCSLYALTPYFYFLSKHEQCDAHQHHIGRAVIEKQFHLFGSAAFLQRDMAEAEECDGKSCRKHRDSPSQRLAQAPVGVPQIMSQQEIAVESGKVVQHVELIP